MVAKLILLFLSKKVSKLAQVASEPRQQLEPDLVRELAHSWDQVRLTADLNSDFGRKSLLGLAVSLIGSHHIREEPQAVINQLGIR